MAEPRPSYRRFDVVLWVILLGLLVGFARWTWQVIHGPASMEPSGPLCLFGVFVWLAVWLASRANRGTSRCAECGRRFRPSEQEPGAPLCARCRLRAPGSGRTAPRRPRFHLFDLVLGVILSAFVLGFYRAAEHMADEPFREDRSGWFYLTGIVVCGIVWSVFRARRTAPECQECGRRFIPPQSDLDAVLCPQCRLRSLGPKQLQREEVKGRWMILGFTVVLAAIIGLNLWTSRSGWTGRFAPIAIPFLALGAAVALLATAFVVFLVVLFVRNQLFRIERHALAFARKCARQEGVIARTGPLSFWSCTATDATPLLLDELAIASRRFERLTGQPLANLPPLRVLVFDRRSALVAFHRNVIAGMDQVHGVYLYRPARTMTLTTEILRHVLNDLQTTIRSLFLYYLLDVQKGELSIQWLQSGITNALSNDPGGDPRRQLNRRMKLSLSRGTAMDAAELFLVSPRELFRRMRGLADHESYARLAQFTGQSWSVVEYLAGPEAPADRVGRFRSFLAEVRSIRAQEDLFAHHFGYRFDALLERWKAWVQEQESGDYRPPPPETRTALCERLVPTIRDPARPARERVHAIRAMGIAGYACGSDSLIELLREGDDQLAADAAWALECISGLSLGRDADRWSTWRAGLDPAAIGAEGSGQT